MTPSEIAVDDKPRVSKTFEGLVRDTMEFFRQNQLFEGMPVLSITAAARHVCQLQQLNPTDHRQIERESLVRMESRYTQSRIMGMDIYNRIGDEAKHRLGTEFGELFDQHNSAWRVAHPNYEL